ncbi:MAG TPA: carboxypeptidase-like regulatory domain-containing protein [Candidatus Saccharimonas sp.]|nr:carboxypeptidase-like regulatory domain-containing protein [Candidatus Saccharimonas sp.]
MSEEQKDESKDVAAPQKTHATPEPQTQPTPLHTGVITGHNKKSFWSFFKTKKGKITLGIVTGVIVLVAVLLAVPVTRYGMLGPFIHKDLAVMVVDSKTGKPVSDATVSVTGATAHTDNNGKATLPKLSVGTYTLSVTKKYYKDASLPALVPILHDPSVGTLKLEATGRQVPITVVNKITGVALAKATIVAGDATAITDNKGQTTLVLPANDATVAASIKADNYNTSSVNVTVTEQQDPKNTFTLTPVGKVYFLSKRTGIINVMKSDLDGGNQQIVVQGTGKEDDKGTVLLASRDWKYLLLQARRDNNQGLYVINTTNDQFTQIDTGNVAFTSIGWHNHVFAYQVEHEDIPYGQPKRYALKSYDAEANKLVTLAETNTQGGGPENFAYTYFDDEKGALVYVSNMQNSGGVQGAIVSVQLDGSNKKTLYSLSANSFVSFAISYAPNEFYYSVVSYSSSDPAKVYEYGDGAVKANTSVTPDQVSQQFYPTFLQSPSGSQTFWYEPRDGKNTLFIGDKDGKNGKQIATASDFAPYGWYSDDYLLVSKNGSELYIVPAKNADLSKAIKLSDYHKPVGNFYGYGGGYGGF